MGRHSLAKGRRISPVALASVLGPAAAIWLGVASDTPVDREPTRAEAAPVDDVAPPCCVEVVAAGANQVAMTAAPGEPATVQMASRWRPIDMTLPQGVASERGLQVKTILAARAISAEFPQIRQIGGVRPDALRWHPNGLAIDVMIPNPTSAEGIALGNEIVAFVLRNAKRFALQDAIWRGVYYTPEGARGGAYGHYDHVHVTTKGGGYPTGHEVYLR
ncbi:hypothetical protein MHAS_04652 [Mycolicibacterium hassiacum DSM 44199]|uniref:hypothetical protein n=1 Tax=Mycolicibacterium hassiacum TaxID=46351 RepID=UPI000475EDD3|nr:hypothetical protein [Mycolicibacterium hassiacum]MBX5489251.1 hypothetical protein [Mycolicibacterium hassiacum]VCT92916.1 hypothetical protein MHAS_04652 [Mycolicibacterium hassiacum DSM 44199]